MLIFLRLKLLALTLVAVSCARHDEPESPSRAAHAALAQKVSEPMVAPGEVAPSERHLLLTVKLTEAGLEVLDFRQVSFPLPVNRGRREEPWRVEIEDGSGKTVYLAQLAAPALLRGELAGPGGAIEAVRLSTSEHFFSIRLPALSRAATVRLFGPAKDPSVAPLDERGHASLPDPVKP